MGMRFQAHLPGRSPHRTKRVMESAIRQDTLGDWVRPIIHPAGSPSTIARHLFPGCEPSFAELWTDTNNNIILLVDGIILAVYHGDIFLSAPRDIWKTFSSYQLSLACFFPKCRWCDGVVLVCILFSLLTSRVSTFSSSSFLLFLFVYMMKLPIGIVNKKDAWEKKIRKYEKKIIKHVWKKILKKI